MRLEQIASKLACRPRWHIIASVVVLIAGCHQAQTSGWSDARATDLQLSLNEIFTNNAAQRYGMLFQEGILRSDLFSVELHYLPFGFMGDFHNTTEFPMILMWELCTLVDGEGWCHGIIYPESLGAPPESVYPRIVIAPQSKRRVPLVPRTMARRYVIRPEPPESFHPRLADLPASGVTERLILWLEYREQSLMYDLQITLARRVDSGGISDTVTLTDKEAQQGGEEGNMQD